MSLDVEEEEVASCEVACFVVTVFAGVPLLLLVSSSEVC